MMAILLKCQSVKYWASQALWRALLSIDFSIQLFTSHDRNDNCDLYRCSEM